MALTAPAVPEVWADTESAALSPLGRGIASSLRLLQEQKTVVKIERGDYTSSDNHHRVDNSEKLEVGEADWYGDGDRHIQSHFVGRYGVLWGKMMNCPALWGGKVSHFWSATSQCEVVADVPEASITSRESN